MKKTRKRPAESNKLFDPDLIVTKISQALRRDFEQATHAYHSFDCTTLKAFNIQIDAFEKKYLSWTTDQTPLEDKAFSTFEKVNLHMGEVNEKLSLSFSQINESRVQSKTEEDVKIHLRARALMLSVLGSFDFCEWSDECRNSAGSSIGVPFTDTSLEKKFTLPMTVTKRAEPILRSILSDNFQLADAIEKFNSGTVTGSWFDRVDGSRATTVDKSNDKRRFICVEPTGNMYLQQGLMQMMYRRMSKFGLDVERLPQRHVIEARLSSISGLNATIDWSSASDCVSIELLRWLLPPDWFDAVWSVRCDLTHIRGKKVPLNMISSMGNATTFPLETLVFWTYAHACRLTQNAETTSLFPEWEDLMMCSVFGDDCIVPTPLAPYFMEKMVKFGFIVNDDKSFYGTEKFRESCGGDFLNGFNVRPFCIKAPQSRRKSSLESWLYIIANSFKTKYITYFGMNCYVYEKELWSTIFDLFREHGLQVKVVPGYFPDDSGLKIGEDLFRFQNSYPMRLSRIAKSRHGTYSFAYKRFVYRHRYQQDDYLRFVEELQSSSRTYVDDYLPFDPKNISPWSLRGNVPKSLNNVRKLGGYVVAKAISAHWTVTSMSMR